MKTWILVAMAVLLVGLGIVEADIETEPPPCGSGCVYQTTANYVRVMGNGGDQHVIFKDEVECAGYFNIPGGNNSHHPDGENALPRAYYQVIPNSQNCVCGRVCPGVQGGLLGDSITVGTLGLSPGFCYPPVNNTTVPDGYYPCYSKCITPIGSPPPWM